MLASVVSSSEATSTDATVAGSSTNAARDSSDVPETTGRAAICGAGADIQSPASTAIKAAAANAGTARQKTTVGRLIAGCVTTSVLTPRPIVSAMPLRCAAQK